MVADYFWIRRGNYFVEDLYTSNPNGRYWYYKGWHWRAYVAYICSIALPFPGFLGQLGVKTVNEPVNATTKIYNIGYLTSFLTSMAVYTLLCKVIPPEHVAEARAMAFECIGDKEVLIGEEADYSDKVEEGDVEETKVTVDAKD